MTPEIKFLTSPKGAGVSDDPINDEILKSGTHGNHRPMIYLILIVIYMGLIYLIVIL